MDEIITILDADHDSRQAIENTIKIENLTGLCGVQIPGDARGRLWLGFANETRPSSIPEESCFTKPIRIGAILERARRMKGRKTDEIFSFGPYTLDCGESELRNADRGTSARLTEKEAGILAALARARGKSIDRKTLLKAIWGYAEGIETHTLETHIYRLRQKIERDPARPEILLTDETGYRLAL